MEASDEEVRFF